MADMTERPLARGRRATETWLEWLYALGPVVALTLGATDPTWS